MLDARNYYDRCRTLQKHLGSKSRGSMTLERIAAFGKSIKRQLFSQGGPEYFKFLFETAVKRPREFPEAVSLAIKLDHFKYLTKETKNAHGYSTHVETLYQSFKERSQAIIDKYDKEIHE